MGLDIEHIDFESYFWNKKICEKIVVEELFFSSFGSKSAGNMLRVIKLVVLSESCDILRGSKYPENFN